MLCQSFHRSTRTTAAALAICLSAATAQAQVTFDWATIGNAGNAADTTGRGAVGYDFRIATTEVTNAQYAEFLNAVAATDTQSLYRTEMSGDFGGITRSGASGSYTYATKAGRAKNPVTLVNWYDSARFVNWLHNGQGNGSTETGAYTLLGGTPVPSNSTTIARDAGANYFIPTQNEWYKTAYHDASAGTAGVYFDYATGTDVVPYSDGPAALSTPDNTNAANFFRDDEDFNAPHDDPTPGYNDGHAVWNQNNGFAPTDAQSSDNPLTDVGAYVDSPSTYGTFDQNGNVWEWNEDISLITVDTKVFRNIAGGGWGSGKLSLSSALTWHNDISFGASDRGFRVASVVPEPSSLALLGFGGLLIARRRRG